MMKASTVPKSLKKNVKRIDENIKDMLKGKSHEEISRKIKTMSKEQLDALVTKTNNISVLKELLSAGADPNVMNYFIHYENAIEFLTVLLDHGANINVSTHGRPPLHHAAYMGDDYLHITEFLIQMGADINLRRSYTGSTPLFIAALNNHVETIKLLLYYGADPNIKDNEGRKPINVVTDLDGVMALLNCPMTVVTQKDLDYFQRKLLRQLKRKRSLG